MKNKLILLAVFLAEIGLNSFDIRISEPFKFNNPVPIHATQKQIKDIVAARPEMKDKTLELDLLGFSFPILTSRTVIDSVNKKSYSGILDGEKNIYTFNGTYKLQSAHDSNWYLKK